MPMESVPWHHNDYQAYFTFLYKNANKIYWKKMTAFRTLKKMVKDFKKMGDKKLNPHHLVTLKKLNIKPSVVWMLKDIRHLYAGDIFGEIALQQKQPRSASVLAVSDCVFATLNKAAYEKALEAAIAKLNERSLKLLQHFPLFKTFPQARLIKLIPSMKLRFFQRGNYVFKQGSSSNEVFITLSGEFELVITEKTNQKVQSRILKDKFVKEDLPIKLRHITRTQRVALIGSQQIVGIEEMIPMLKRVNNKTQGSGTQMGQKQDFSTPLRFCSLIALNNNCEAFSISKSELISTVGINFRLNHLESL